MKSIERYAGAIQRHVKNPPPRRVPPLLESESGTLGKDSANVLDSGELPVICRIREILTG